jgi:hypothetical protein
VFFDLRPKIRAQSAGIYKGFGPNRRQQGLQHFSSLNLTLSHKDSEEIEKGKKLV